MKILPGLIFAMLFSTFTVKAQSTIEDFLNAHIDSLKNSNIIWLGEMHGTQKSFDIAYEMLATLDDQLEIDYLLLEYSYITEVQLNHYLETGNEDVLNKIMESFKKTFSYTEEQKSFLKKLYEFNLTRPKDRKLKTISIDIEHQWPYTHRQIIKNYEKKIPADSSLLIYDIKNRTDYPTFYSQLLEDLEKNEALYRNLYKDDYYYLYYAVRNIHYRFLTSQSKNFNDTRDSLIYENFKYRNTKTDLSYTTSFAIWGRDHTYQYKTQKTNWIASKIKMHNPEINQTTFSCLYSHSKFNIPTTLAPGFLRWLYKGDYTTTNLMNNDNMFAKINGTKRLTSKAISDVTFFDIQELPENKDFVYKRDKTQRNADYLQYIILVMNSPACQPLQ